MHKLDRTDLKILQELQTNGRISNADLAERINLSPSPCLTRVKKLQAAGYIETFAARINLRKLGSVITVFTEVTLKTQRQRDFEVFLQAVAGIDTVEECHTISGNYDFLLKIVCRNISAYQAVMEQLTHMDIGIEKYFSYVVLNSPIDRGQVSVNTLFPQTEKR